MTCYHEFGEARPVRMEWYGDRAEVHCVSTCTLCGLFTTLVWRSDPLAWSWDSPYAEDPYICPSVDRETPAVFRPDRRDRTPVPPQV